MFFRFSASPVEHVRSFYWSTWKFLRFLNTSLAHITDIMNVVINESNFESRQLLFLARRVVSSRKYGGCHMRCTTCFRNNKMDMYHSNKPVHRDPFLRLLSLIIACIIIYNYKAWFAQLSTWLGQYKDELPVEGRPGRYWLREKWPWGEWGEG